MKTGFGGSELKIAFYKNILELFKATFCSQANFCNYEPYHFYNRKNQENWFKIFLASRS